MELVLRTSAILLAAWLCARLLPRASAATRHLLWHVALLAVLAAPIVSPWVPRLAVPGLGRASQEIERRLDAALAPGGPAVAPPLGPQTVASQSAAPLPTPSASARATPVDPGPRLAASLWATGSLAVAAWFAIGWVLALRRARDASDAPVAWQMEANDIVARLRIAREVRLCMLDADASPLTVGVLTPRVLLPPAAASWDVDQRRAVLWHELAHVRRHDVRLQVMTQAACAMYWFNPLMWMAAAALRRERERACDDEVLRHGAKPSTYAACLIDVARLIRPDRTPSAALAMARSSELEGRLLAVLGDRAREPSRVGRGLVLLTMTTSVMAVLGASPGREVAPLPLAATAITRTPAGFLTTTRPVVEHSGPRNGIEEAATTLQTSPDAGAREQAALALADATASSAIDVLVAALADSSGDVREKAALALALQSGPRVIEPLIRALGDADGQVREKAAAGLALRRDPRVLQPLLAALRDPEAQVREKAALALGTSGDARARAGLEAATRDPDAQVREKAVTGLMLLDMPPSAHEGEPLRSGLRDLVGAVMRLVR